MSNFVYVDNSNVWIEGMRVSAVAHGLAPDIFTAMQDDILDQSWRVDLGRLFEFAGGDDSQIGRAVLYGSRPPANDSLWAAAERIGFEVVVHDRNVANKERKIDTSIVTDIVSDSYELMNPENDEITLVAGDTDYVPAITSLRERGFRVDVLFWNQASKELKETCSLFVSLNPYLAHIRFK